jgi:WD40 repeat protein
VGVLLGAVLVGGVVLVVGALTRPGEQSAGATPATQPAAKSDPSTPSPPPDPPVGQLWAYDKHEGHAARAVFVPGGKYVLSCGGGDGTIQPFPPAHFQLRLLDRQTGQEVRRFDPQHKAGVIGLAVSPDGKRALSSSGGMEGNVCLWDVATGACLRVLAGHRGSVGVVAFTPDGKRGVSGGGRDGSIRSWDLETGDQLPAKFQDHPRGVACLLCLPGDRLLSSGATDGLVRLHALDTGNELAVFRPGDPVSAVAALDGGKQVLTLSTDGTVRVWDTAEQRVVRQLPTVANVMHPLRPFGSAFSEDGKWLLIAAADNNVHLWEVTEGRELHSYAGHTQPRPLPGGAVSSVAFAPDGPYAVSAGWDGTVRLWGLPVAK